MAQLGIDALLGVYEQIEESKPRLTTLAIQGPTINLRGKNVPIAQLDSGLSGVLDKLMAIRANRYIVGEPHKCSRKSTYALQIIRERLTEMANNPDSKLSNALDYFPEAGPDSYDLDIELAIWAKEEEEAGESSEDSDESTMT